MDTRLHSDLEELESILTGLRNNGITLSGREKQQMATEVKADINRDVTPPKRKNVLEQMLGFAEKALPLVGPILSLI